MLTSLGVTAGCLVAFAGIRSNQHPSKYNYAESSKANTTKKSSSKATESSKSDSEKGNSKSNQFAANHKDRPNVGKIVKLNSVEAAKTTIIEYEATCSYSNEPFYPGLVYTGTYTCKCGLRIIWWDKAMKESVDQDMESFSNKGIHGPEEYSYGTDDLWKKKADSNLLSETQESTEISSAD